MGTEQIFRTELFLRPVTDWRWDGIDAGLRISKGPRFAILEFDDLYSLQHFLRDIEPSIGGSKAMTGVIETR